MSTIDKIDRRKNNKGAPKGNQNAKKNDAKIKYVTLAQTTEPVRIEIESYAKDAGFSSRTEYVVAACRAFSKKQQ